MFVGFSATNDAITNDLINLDAVVNGLVASRKCCECANMT